MSGTLTTPKLVGCSDGINLLGALSKKGTRAYTPRSLYAMLVHPTVSDIDRQPTRT